MFKTFLRFIPFLLVGLAFAVLARPKTPEQTLMAFLKHIKNHECSDAEALAVDYSQDDCKSITQFRIIKPPSLIVGSKDNDKNVFLYRVEFQSNGQRFQQPNDGQMKLARENGQWKVFFESWNVEPEQFSENTLEQKSNLANDNHAQSNSRLNGNYAPEIQAGSERVLSNKKPVSGSSQKKPAPSTLPAINKQTESLQAPLLQLWSTKDLDGKPGDERITPLSTPDFNPPVTTHISHIPPANQRVIPDSIRRVRLPDDQKLVALTFDLCEQADEITGYDRAIVNTLREKGVKATFYAGGKWMQSHREKTMQLMADPLFEIGNHGWTHGNLRLMTGSKMHEQIDWTQAEYQTIRNALWQKARSHGLESEMNNIPELPRTLRFPYGTCSTESLNAVNHRGLDAVQWDVVSGDPGGIAPAANIIQSVHPGSIVVFHANGRGRGTAAALPIIIEGLKRKGFDFVTVSDLLALAPADTKSECYEVKPGDNKHYDAQFGEGTVSIRHKRSPAVPVTTAVKTPVKTIKN